MPNAYAFTLVFAILIILIIYETQHHHHHRKAISFTLFNETGRTLNNMITNIMVGRERIVTIDPTSIKDAAGRVTKVDGPFTFAIDTANKFNLVPAADGMSCAVIAVVPTNPGEIATLTVDADVDLGPDVKILAETTQFTASFAQAVTFDVTVGPEQDPS